ncbi:MAG: ChbG/HpnK family deacetylase [Gammaproteobacteria bacterium]|nr:ChbG/HpnK family deacetylase [Gammaproteobacteria bacterium]
MKKQRKITINVDDLGLSEAVNEAVVELANLGRIHSSSYMVGGNISHKHKSALGAMNIDIGLHLDFTGIFQSPLTQSLQQVLLKSYTRQIDIDAAAENIASQFSQFEATFGRAPVFVDGHQHVHQFPVIRKALMTHIIEKYQGTVATRITKPIARDIKSRIIYALGGWTWQKLCQKYAINSNKYFAGVYDFDADETQLTHLWKQWLSASKENTLIMCHPATPCSNWSDEIKAAREREYSYLISDEFASLLEQYSN